LRFINEQQAPAPSKGSQAGVFVLKLFVLPAGIENRQGGAYQTGAPINYEREAVLPRGVKSPREAEIVRGAIIGVVDIVDVVENHRSKWFSGPFGFVLSNPRALLKPVSCPGRLSFWEVPPDIMRAIQKQLH
jgi:hypothetical protein